MKNMAYQRKVDTRNEMVERISDDARHIDNAAVLHTVTHSLAKRNAPCIQVGGGHFKQVLSGT
jgi:hypothetical protein